MGCLKAFGAVTAAGCHNSAAGHANAAGTNDRDPPAVGSASGGYSRGADTIPF